MLIPYVHKNSVPSLVVYTFMLRFRIQDQIRTHRDRKNSKISPEKMHSLGTGV
jgi:hypothetical protein